MTTGTLKTLRELKFKGSRPKIDQVLTLLKAEINTYSTVVIAVDALDEIPAKTRAQLLVHLRNLSRNIRLIATSRKLLDIADDFGDDMYLEIVANADNMRRYIESRISGSGILKRLLNNHQSLREDLISTVVKKADGM